VPAALDLAQRIAPLAHGEVAAVKLATKPGNCRLAFRDAADSRNRLPNGMAGPCFLICGRRGACRAARNAGARRAAGQARRAGFRSGCDHIDTRDPDKPKNWLRDIGIGRLAYYSDANAKVFQDLKAVGKAIGMPTTLLIDPNGCEIASLAGPANGRATTA